MEYLVTPSLYNAWLWYMRSEQSKEDFLNVLNKIKQTPTAAMQAGIDFENDVRALSENFTSWTMKSEATSECIKELGDFLTGAIWQQKLKKQILIHGNMPVMLYGIADAIKANTIYDLKFTKNYKVGKYRQSIQHLLYMCCADFGIDHFDYLVSDGVSIWKESYTWDQYASEILLGKIADMMQFIMNDKDFKAAYTANWTARRDS